MDGLQRADALLQPVAVLAVAFLHQQERVDRRLERFAVALALVFDPAQELRGLAVEGVVAPGQAKLRRRRVEALAAKEDLAVELVDEGVDDVLAAGDLEAFDGLLALAAFFVECRQAEEVGRVDRVAPHLLAQRLLDRVRGLSGFLGDLVPRHATGILARHPPPDSAPGLHIAA